MPAMRYLHEKFRFVLRLTLLSLLLSAQALSLMHELDHVGLPDNPQCAVCSVSGSLSGPVVIEHESWDASPADLAPVTDRHYAAILRPFTPPPARAPPAQSVSINA